MDRLNRIVGDKAIPIAWLMSWFIRARASRLPPRDDTANWMTWALLNFEAAAKQSPPKIALRILAWGDQPVCPLPSCQLASINFVEYFLE
jgi:hypothetical protein